MAITGAAALAGAVTNIADQTETNAAKTAVDAANANFKMQKDGREKSLALI